MWSWQRLYLLSVLLNIMSTSTPPLTYHLFLDQSRKAWAFGLTLRFCILRPFSAYTDLYSLSQLMLVHLMVSTHSHLLEVIQVYACRQWSVTIDVFVNLSTFLWWFQKDSGVLISLFIILVFAYHHSLPRSENIPSKHVISQTRLSLFFIFTVKLLKHLMT